MKLPIPPLQYDQQDQAQTRQAMELADEVNIKTTTVLGKFYMKDTATGHIKTIVITSGAFVIS